MRKPETIECLYLDFDGFFASVEQQAKPALRGKPIGIVPFDNTEFTCVIACSKEAKAKGCHNVDTIFHTDLPDDFPHSLLNITHEDFITVLC